MKVLFIASEAAPLIKVGGLGDVVGSLPKALISLGHDVRVLIPQYDSIDTRRFPLTPLKTGFSFNMPGQNQTVDINQTMSESVPIYTVENRQYFGTKEVYINELERFFFFSRAAFALLPELDWQPEIIHCHDWLTALLIMWQKKAGYPYSSVFTIHNLAYQGFFDEGFMRRHDLEKDVNSPPPGSPRPPYSFMSQAILWADLITAVSETYAREIATPDYGSGLDGLLRYRGDSLAGIINGIDYTFWDSQDDPLLPVNFSAESLQKRVFNKIALQRVAGLTPDSSIPLIGMVQRLDEQKGIDIVGQGIDQIVRETGAQFVILGKGRQDYEEMLRQIAARYPHQVAAFVAFEEPLAHLIYAGCDIFLMPSHFEPCGLAQLIAMRYGALPVVRHTGGLVDTVPQFSPDLSQGNGFIFHEYSPRALAGAVKEAVIAYQNKSAWKRAMQRVSKLDFSWQSSARKYETVYRQVLHKTVL